MTETDQSRAARIATANDHFRRTATRGIVFSAALAAEGLNVMAQLVRKVRAFDAFTPANDPHGEHDFGSFAHAIGGREETIFWKIDTGACPGPRSGADASLTCGADDPLSPGAVRILTIMLATDY